MKYYITEKGEVVSTSRFFGEFDCMSDAKKAAFGEMNNGDILSEFPDDTDPWEEDEWGYRYVDLDMATEIVPLLRSDDSIEGIPEGKWVWGEDLEDIYNSDGTKWDGEE